MALTHRFIKRRERAGGKWQAVWELMDGESVLAGFAPWYDHYPEDSEIAEHIALVKAKRKSDFDRDAITDRRLESVGNELREVLKWLIENIRNYPNVTLAQASNAWNAKWADSLFTFDRLVSFAQKKLGNMSWDGFKNHVIEHHIAGID